VRQAVDAGVAAFGKLNILYNNAGVLWRDRDFEVTRTVEEDWNRVMDINLKGAVWVCKYGIPELVKQGGGSIINIASVSALLGFTKAQDAYTCSKGALISLTRSLAIVYADKKIRANVIHPGPVDTPMQKEWDEETKKAIADWVPLGRLAQPEDIAYCALFLASDESSYITGTEIIVDGGIMVKGG
jgi:NAD(P)-dependent dehydrogenase (short-subunit alcohol dehydrogenase family)